MIKINIISGFLGAGKTTLINRLINDVYKDERELTNYLINELKKVKKCILYLPQDIDKCFGIVSINITGYTSEDVGMILDDEFDICVRTGYHCAPYIHDFIGDLVYNGSVRISINYFNSKEDVNNLIRALESL